jgi:hypothetical protein
MDESYSTHEEILNTYGILVVKSERKLGLRRWRDNININPEECSVKV